MSGARHSLWATGVVIASLALTAACNKAEESPRSAAYPPAASAQPSPPATVPAPAPAVAAPGSTEPAVSPPAVVPPPVAAPPPAGAELAAPAAVAMPPSAAPAAATAQTSAATPLAVEQHSVSGIEVALMDVRRTSGDTVTVRWQYRNTLTAGQDVDELWQNYVIADRAYLIDPGNKKKYLVVRDAANTPVASQHTNRHIAAGKSTASWAKFPAPPPDVTKITVAIPNAPPFEDVPFK